ncbi:hypothetical protein SGFS_018390 [Streptomyces graminofaciens]|uniref:Uncharacterized protein n=1 Tax=Streptomyces graminofaciens TaxID=68212 RepID=A0ABM7F4G7_9ACTN|nr:hypothetical protein SGFS_018390 [Streptomyces graminofaciens]
MHPCPKPTAVGDRNHNGARRTEDSRRFRAPSRTACGQRPSAKARQRCASAEPTWRSGVTIDNRPTSQSMPWGAQSIKELK